LHANYYQLALDLWDVLLLVWLIGAFTTKTTARRQSRGSRVVQSILTVYGLYLAVALHVPTGWMNTPLYTPTDATGTLGLLLTLLGVLFAIWARITLGSNWSGSVTLKEDHTLVRRGPYAIVRHPIYTGFLLAALGVGLIIGELRGLIGTAIVFIGFSLKYRTEESFMLENFGEQYATYQREVKALIPFIY
jgi:protein-S-isoprenylcysteine O-methyltransferase Ste14